MPDFQDLLCEVTSGVALVTLNQPQKLNALSDAMIDGLVQCLTTASEDDAVRAVVITGAGKGFCSGRDVSPTARGVETDAPASVADARYNLRHIHKISWAAQRLNKPYIAAINGAAAGAGMDLASMADIRFASRDARFTQAYTRNGIVPGNGGCYFLPRIVGMAKALELLWTSRKFDADEALAIGYVTRVIEPALLVEETLTFARELVAGPPLVIDYIKQLCYMSQSLDLSSSLKMAQYVQTIAMNTADAREGLVALREKRAPRFTGK
jgi:enoyl-CoA hydratase/carnithine racemase